MLPDIKRGGRRIREVAHGDSTRNGTQPAVPVWADGHETKVAYTAPSALADRYQLADDLATKLAGIDAVTDAAIDG